MNRRMNRGRPSPIRRAIPVLCAGLLLLSGPALAGPPAAIPESGPERAERALRSFSTQWMTKIRGQASKQGPRSGASGITYREYGEEVQTELKATGYAEAPYVGIIRYKEHIYSCADARGEDCQLASVTPVTEIFRFQGGRWVY